MQAANVIHVVRLSEPIRSVYFYFAGRIFASRNSFVKGHKFTCIPDMQGIKITGEGVDSFKCPRSPQRVLNGKLNLPLVNYEMQRSRNKSSLCVGQ